MVIAGCEDDPAPEVSTPRLVAGFDVEFEQPATGPTSCPVVTIRFFDRSSGAPTAWRWTFGDGSTSSEQNPIRDTSIIYDDVTLRISRGGSSDTVTKQISTHEC